MADTLTAEKWGNKESADWWSAGQARRQQIYGAATEMMLDLAGIHAGSRVLAVDVAASMLNVAAEATRKESLRHVGTRVVDAENLMFDADSFDAVICRI